MKFGDSVASIEDCISGMDKIPAGSVDLVVTDPPYNLQKAIANDDMNEHEFFDFTRLWVTGVLRALKKDGSIYVMCGVKYHPYIYLIIEKEFDLVHINTIIWAYSHSIHGVKRMLQSSYDPVLLFAKSKDYTFNMDDLRDPFAFARFDKKNNRMGPALPDVWYIEAPRWNHPERYEFYKKNGRGDIIEKGHPMQKPISLFKRMIQLSSNPGDTVLDPFMGCYDDQTEIMTEKRGFVKFEHLLPSDKVESLVDGRIEFVAPLRHFKYTYSGEMYRVNGRSIDLLVTPNHNLYCKEYHQEEFQLIPVSDVHYKTIHFKSTCNWASENIKLRPDENFTVEQYAGFVYCVEVPSHVIYVRRNGKCCWCGNSGTSGVAAIKTGRKFIGFEIDPRWKNIIDQRMSAARSERSSKKLTDFTGEI